MGVPLVRDDRPHALPPRRRHAPALPRAGVMNAMFERALTDDAFAKYEPVALSRSPWVLPLDHFLDGSEAEHLIGVPGSRNSWSRSMAGDGVQAVRTSSTSWCSAKSGCGGDVLRGVRRRIANVTMAPASNAEHLQLLKYEPGSEHRRPELAADVGVGPCGSTRGSCTSTTSRDGGAADALHDPQHLGAPAPLPVVLWPSVLDAQPNERDDRTEHEAVAVREGTKFAANSGCTCGTLRGPDALGCGNTEVFGNW